jgi:hypothetical protein
MNPILAGVALAVTAGAVIAVSSREARAAYLGLVLALGLGPFIADPLPGPGVLGARVVTGILVVYLLRAVSTGADVRGLGSRIGWPAEALLASAAGIAGVAIAAGLDSLQPGARGAAQGPLDALTPSALTLAAGLAAIAVGVTPAFLARTSLRSVIGLLLILQGVALTRTGIAGPPGELEQLGVDGLVLAVGIAGALIVTLERRGGSSATAPHGAAPDAR